jgi:hypothetical protein
MARRRNGDITERMTKRTAAALLAGACIAACATDASGERTRREGTASEPSWDPSSPTDMPGAPADRDVALPGSTDPATVPAAAAGGCGGGCQQQRFGEGGEPFDPAAATGLGIDMDGALVLRGAGGTGSKYIWIANTGEHTISKIDVETYVEEGRYLLDSGETRYNTGNYGVDPSRTSVNLAGDAFVGSRAGSALTRISSLGEGCPDTNGDGVVTTSTGPMDVLPWGQDDCVLWQTKLSGTIRGVAAQDILGETKVEMRLDGPPEVTSTPSEHYVWVGNTEAQLWKIDAETGAILIEMKAPTGVYGLALNGTGRLYSTAGGLGADFGWVDTTRCVDAASCAVPRCDFTCEPGACGNACDGAVVARADLMLSAGSTYGITVDCKQRLWLGGSVGNVLRWDPSALPNTRLVEVPGSEYVMGIGADRNGWVWGARSDNVLRIQGDTLETAQLAVGGAKGIGIDANGKVWAVSQAFEAYVVDPGADLNGAAVVHTVTGLVSPYTYSDMTGEQLRLGTREPGYYRQVFEGCPATDAIPTEWLELTYEAELPAGTWIVFRARTADSAKDLASAPWVDIGAAPGRDSPVEITPFFGGMDPGRLLEIEVELLTHATPTSVVDRCAASTGAPVSIETPRLQSFGLSHRCRDTID